MNHELKKIMIDDINSYMSVFTKANGFYKYMSGILKFTRTLGNQRFEENG